MDEDIEMIDAKNYDTVPIKVNNIESKLPFVEKYRPSTLEEIISQDHVVKTIKKFLDKNSLTHLLFYGTAGTGKTTCAKAIANFLYGKNKPGNLLELNASDERGIDIVKEQIKNFCQTLNSFSNFNSMNDSDKEDKNFFKLVMLDEADMMTTDAQSALRRIMEKYTNNVRFILICNQLHKIHPAVQSRTMRLRFRPIQKEKCINRLKEICKYENINYENDETLQTIIDLGERDMRKMLNLLEATSMASKDNNIGINDVYITAGLPSIKEFKDIVSYIARKDISLEKVYNFTNETRLSKGFAVNDLMNILHSFLKKDQNLSDEDFRKFGLKLRDLEMILIKGGDEEVVLQNLICLILSLIHI